MNRQRRAGSDNAVVPDAAARKDAVQLPGVESDHAREYMRQYRAVVIQQR